MRARCDRTVAKVRSNRAQSRSIRPKISALAALIAFSSSVRPVAFSGGKVRIIVEIMRFSLAGAIDA